ncbi:MAG: aspartate dehydrogenase [Eubacteriales bacterium]|nr:aspartate dehydrogenase [Eubacteriales bacterium]
MKEKKDGGKNREQRTYDKERKRPVLKCSICNGEQVAGFKDIHTGEFEEVMFIRNDQELQEFLQMYGIERITKEY